MTHIPTRQAYGIPTRLERRTNTGTVDLSGRHHHVKKWKTKSIQTLSRNMENIFWHYSKMKYFARGGTPKKTTWSKRASKNNHTFVNKGTHVEPKRRKMILNYSFCPSEMLLLQCVVHFSARSVFRQLWVPVGRLRSANKSQQIREWPAEKILQ